MDNAVLFTVGSICFSALLFDGIFLAIILYTRQKVKQAANWPSTMGTVVFSTIQWRRGSKGGSVAYPSINYTYQVGGNAYESNKVMPGMESGGTGAHKVVERYPAGAQVMVYYDPQDPSKALLERSMPGYIKWLWGALIITDIFLCGMATVFAFSL
jgi:hypothetical protein